MNKTTDPLVQIILEKRMRKRIVEMQRTGKSFKNKSPKPDLRDFRKQKRI